MSPTKNLRYYARGKVSLLSIHLFILLILALSFLCKLWEACRKSRLDRQIPRKGKTGIWRNSRSSPEISCAEALLGDHLDHNSLSWVQLPFMFTCQHCKHWNQSGTHNCKKASVPVKSFHCNCGISLLISGIIFRDLLCSFIHINYVLVLCSGCYNLKIIPVKESMIPLP